MTPRCPKCEGTNITWKTKTFANIEGIIIYCGDCGTIFSWAPKK